MITIYDIAIKAGVSPSTVSKVVNNYSSIPEDTKKKVRKAMSELNLIEVCESMKSSTIKLNEVNGKVSLDSARIIRKLKEGCYGE